MVHRRFVVSMHAKQAKADATGARNEWVGCVRVGASMRKFGPNATRIRTPLRIVFWGGHVYSRER